MAVPDYTHWRTSVLTQHLPPQQQLTHMDDEVHQFVFVHLLSLKVGHEEADVIALRGGGEGQGKGEV